MSHIGKQKETSYFLANSLSPDGVPCACRYSGKVVNQVDFETVHAVCRSKVVSQLRTRFHMEFFDGGGKMMCIEPRPARGCGRMLPQEIYML